MTMAPLTSTDELARRAEELDASDPLAGWRDEPYGVGPRFAEPLFTIDRGAVPPFGIRGYGVHLNGYVRRGGQLSMWIGRRSPLKRIAPNKFDQLVAGGQPAGISPRENLIKEAAEEAAIPRHVVEQAVPVGAITYCTEHKDGLRNDVLFVYDLELTPDFKPHNTDGELVGFELLPIAEVMELVRTTDAFKFNCSLVVIDFLIRHGLIAPEHPEYLDLVAGLRSGLEVLHGLLDGLGGQVSVTLAQILSQRLRQHDRLRFALDVAPKLVAIA